MKSEKLTTKEKLFVEFYLGESRFNGTDAARRAAYSAKSENALSQQARVLLRKPQIQMQIEARISEAAMSANEVLSRLSDIARGKVTDVVDENGKFNLELAKRNEKDGLLKKLKTKRTSKQVNKFVDGDGESGEAEEFETSLVYEEVEFEMYSAHEALRDLGKYHKLFTEKHEITGANGAPLMQPVADAIEKIYGNDSTK